MAAGKSSRQRGHQDCATNGKRSSLCCSQPVPENCGALLCATLQTDNTQHGMQSAPVNGAAHSPSSRCKRAAAMQRSSNCLISPSCMKLATSDWRDAISLCNWATSARRICLYLWLDALTIFCDSSRSSCKAELGDRKYRIACQHYHHSATELSIIPKDTGQPATVPTPQ